MLSVLLATVCTAEELIPDDKVLTGDEGLGIPLFCIVKTMLYLDDGMIEIRTADDQRVVVHAEAEVVRLEQGINTQLDGSGGIPAGRHTRFPVGQGARGPAWQNGS